MSCTLSDLTDDDEEEVLDVFTESLDDDPWLLEATEASEAALERFLAAQAVPDVDLEMSAVDPSTRLEAALQRFLSRLDIDPTVPRRARGMALWVGFDAEWVFDPVTQTNTILSIQLFVPPDQPALRQRPAQRDQVRALSRVIFADAPTPDGRPSLLASLRQLVNKALRERLIVEAPAVIQVVGFGLRFDLAALVDFPELKTQVDSVSGKVATVSRQATMEFPPLFANGYGLAPELIGLRFIDVAAHVPPGTALRALGQLLNLPKLVIPAPYSIERMDEYLREDRDGYLAYAMRDAEIAVRYAQRLARFAQTELGIKSLPATASGLALKWYLNTLKEARIDPLAAFGWQTVTDEAFHTPTKQRRTFKRIEPTPMRRIQEAFLTDCYAGGRNESFFLGPSPVGHWYDYDLAGAYSTGLADLPLIDFEHPRSSLDLTEYLGPVAGYALVEFVHPPETRFPVFAVSRGGRGLVFPLEGTAYATAPELRVAHDLGCRLTIKWGILYPWRWLPGDDGVDGVPRTRLFGSFVKAARQLRSKLKQQAGGQESLEEQSTKLYANSVYGKIAQSLRSKTVFDTRQVSHVQLAPSAITNPAIAAHVTGFIRAILAEILNRLPAHRMVLSVTTDGFLSDATEAEIDLSGPLCRRFQQLCDEIVPGSKMLEVKHEVAQVVCMKTRGQLTGAALPDKKIVLAKAGVQPLLEADPTLSADAYRALQNDSMLALYLERVPQQTIQRSQFPSLRDQWEKGTDLFKVVREVALSLEPDLKRRLVNPRLETVVARQQTHLAMETRPWRTVAEFDVARAQLDLWRRTHSLKTLEDWASLEELIAVSMVRAMLKATDRPLLNQRQGRPVSDLLRRAFLRAYAQQALGLTRLFTYPAMAALLSDWGYPTKRSEVTSAKDRPLVLGAVPRLPEVMTLWRRLQAQFPEADLTPLLADD